MSQKFSVVETVFGQALLLEPKPFFDDRGFFVESYNKKEFAELGITDDFVQDNHSRSKKGVLRGLHFQRSPHATSKLVRCIRGKIFDVVVDVRKGSSSYGQWRGFELSEQNKRMLYVPVGFAHGFCVLSEEADVVYKVNEFYYPESDAGIRWDDPSIGVGWPVESPLLSPKDASLPLLSSVGDPFYRK